MINLQSQEDCFCAEIQTNVNSETSLQFQDRSYKTLGFARQLKKQPEFADAFAKLGRQNLLKQQLSHIVEEVTQVLLVAINKLVHETFYREISTLVSQVLYIREELNNFTREEAKQRENLKSQLKQEVVKMNKNIEHFKKESRTLSQPNFSKILNSRRYQREISNDMDQLSKWQLGESKIRNQVDFCLEKLEELKTDSLKQQFQIAQKIQQTRQKHFVAYNSLSSQIEQISENLSALKIIQINVKQLFQSFQKLKELLFDSQKQVAYIKQALNRYSEQGIFYFSL